MMSIKLHISLYRDNVNYVIGFKAGSAVVVFGLTKYKYMNCHKADNVGVSMTSHNIHTGD